MRNFSAKTERAVQPGVIDALIHLPFGIAVSRRIQIEGAPPCSPGMRKEAMHCLVILCGGKNVYVVTDETQVDWTIRAQVGVRAKSVPPCCEIAVADEFLLDIGRFLAVIDPGGYPVTEVRAVLNGAR